MPAEGAQAEAERLHEEARFHKRASRRHRDKAREAMTRLDAIIAGAQRSGITITINRTVPSEEAQSGNREQDQDT